MAEVLISLQGISKYYGSQRILTGINLDIAKGEVLGVVGANGSGKSTLLKIVLGLVYPNVGLIKGSAGGSIQIGALLDKPGFFPGFCLEKNLVLFSGGRRSEKIIGVCDRLGLKPYLGQKFSECSTGVQKRCELAAALLREPQLLVMDEPVSGLDPAGVYAFRAIVRELQERQCAVLIADHSLGELEKLCTRICFMKQGIIQCVESTDELLKRFNNLEEAYRFYNLKITRP